jgi:hypothetical protein
MNEALQRDDADVRIDATFRNGFVTAVASSLASRSAS